MSAAIGPSVGGKSRRLMFVAVDRDGAGNWELGTGNVAPGSRFPVPNDGRRPS